MKKTSRILAVLLVLSLTLSLGAFASGGADGFARVDETHWAGGSLSIESVEIADEYLDYVDSTWFDNITKIVYDGGVIDVDNTKYTAILTVDGVQYDLFNAGGKSFTGDVVITIIEKDASITTGNAKFGDDAGSLIAPFYYAAAAYFNEDGYKEESSVPAAQNGAVIDDSSVTGMEYVSNGDYFSGVLVGAGDVTISDSSFTAIGRGGDDFTGQGISVAASGEASLTIDGCVFLSQGALRTAIWSGANAKVDVIDTVVQTLSDEDLVAYNTEDNYATQMMQQTPFALGLTGNVRATLVISQADISFTNCLVASNGWAVLSTDSGNGNLTATDTVAVVGTVEPAEAGAAYDETCVVNGVEYGINYSRVGTGSGYTAFGSGFYDYVYGGRWFAPDYLFIITDGAITVGASETGRFHGWCDRIGFMSNAPGRNTTLTVSESDFEITDTFALVKTKGGNAEAISLTDVTIDLTGENPWSGNLLQLADSDDLGGGPGATTYTIPWSTYDEYLAAPSGGDGAPTALNISDSELTGNIYNSVGSQTGSQTAFRNDTIAVNLDNASLNGAVSSAYAMHCTGDGTALTGEATVDSYGREGTYDYLTLGRLLNFAAPTVNNTVTLSLAKSTWTCTGLSYLASLTLDADSVIDGDVYQDGKLVDLKAGTYENVVVVPAGADYEAAVSAGVEAIEAAVAAGIVPANRSELVANTDLGIGGMFSGSGEASGASGETSGEAADASAETSGEASDASAEADTSIPLTPEEEEEMAALEKQLVPLTGVSNARQLGGYVTEDGRKVKENVLIRSGALANATAEDLAILSDEYNVKLVVDLRSATDVERKPDPEFNDARIVNVPVWDEALNELSLTEFAAFNSQFSSEPGLGDLELYRQGLMGADDTLYIRQTFQNDNSLNGYREFIDLLLEQEEGTGILYHCASGKDRTGSATVILLTLLGVDKETILKDFEMTNLVLKDSLDAKVAASANYTDDEDELYAVRTMNGVNPHFMEKLFEYTEEQSGSLLEYLKEQFGFTDEEIQLLRDKYLE